jgi:hypothetical protein
MVGRREGEQQQQEIACGLKNSSLQSNMQNIDLKPNG